MFFNNPKSVLLKAIEYCLYVFFVLFPFVNYGMYLYSSTSTRSVNLIGLISVLSIAFGIWLLQSKNKISIPKSPIILAMALYGLSMGISALYGYNLHTSFWSNVTRMTGIWYMLNLSIFVLFLTAIFQDRKRQDNLMLALLLSTTLYSVLYFFSFEGLGWIFKDYKNYAFTFGNSTFAAMYIFGAFILSLYYLYTRIEKKWWHYTLPVLLIINPSIISNKLFFGDFSKGITSLVGEARASAAVVFLSVLVLIFAWVVSRLRDDKKRNNIVIGIFIAVVLGIGYTGYSLLSPNGFVREAYLKQATSARPLVWEISTQVIADRPVFGWGGDNFERVFDNYYDSRLLQDEYGNEAWFDRAHNIFVDQGVDGGYVGLSMYLLMYITLGLCMLFVILKSKIKEDVVLATVLLVYFALHLLELQTAFDTSVSYVMVAFLFALAISVYHRTKTETKKDKSEIEVGEGAQYLGAIAIIVFMAWTIIYGLVPFLKTQWANGYLRTVGSSAVRLKEYDTLFASDIDIPSILWRTSADLQRGISEDPRILNDAKAVSSLNNEFKYLENKYREHLRKNPTDFRAHLNLADILIYVRLFNDDRLGEAQKVLDDAIRLVPQSPQAYWMKAVAYIYERKFDLAREWAAKGLEINPKVKESQRIVDYVEESIKNFPDIDLYFFRQT
jgi:O-antigen ligase